MKWDRTNPDFHVYLNSRDDIIGTVVPVKFDVVKWVGSRISKARTGRFFTVGICDSKEEAEKRVEEYWSNRNNQHWVESEVLYGTMGCKRRVVSVEGHVGPWSVVDTTKDAWKKYKAMRKAENESTMH